MKTCIIFPIALLFLTAGIGIAQSCDDILYVPYDENFYEMECIEFCVNDNGSRTICFGPFPSYCPVYYPDAGGVPVDFWNGEYCPSCEVRYDILDVAWAWQTINGQAYICGTAQELTEPYGPACFFIDMYLGNWGSYDCWLPADLISFSAVSVSGGIEIAFVTASETDLSYFEIGREHGGTTSVIARIPASNSAAGAEYSYLDRNVIAGETYRYSLRTVDLDGGIAEHLNHSVTVTYSPNSAVPTELSLNAYPNPFNPATTLTFTIIEDGMVELKVFDVNGREVAALLNERVAAGVHRIDFDGSALSSGVFFARLRSAAHAKMTRLVLIK